MYFLSAVPKTSGKPFPAPDGATVGLPLSDRWKNLLKIFGLFPVFWPSGNVKFVLAIIKLFIDVCHSEWVVFSSCHHENILICVIVRPRYKEIICANIEHSERNSTDNSGNKLLSVFIDIEIWPTYSSIFTFVVVGMHGTNWLNIPNNHKCWHSTNHYGYADIVSCLLLWITVLASDPPHMCPTHSACTLGPYHMMLPWFATVIWCVHICWSAHCFALFQVPFVCICWLAHCFALF